MPKLDPTKPPCIGDTPKLAQQANDIAELLTYYARLLKNPQTTAADIEPVPEIDFNSELLSIYVKLSPLDKTLELSFP